MAEKNNATSPKPFGSVSGYSGQAVPQHKKMAAGDMPKVGGGPKTPA